MAGRLLETPGPLKSGFFVGFLDDFISALGEICLRIVIFCPLDVTADSQLWDFGVSDLHRGVVKYLLSALGLGVAGLSLSGSVLRVVSAYSSGFCIVLAERFSIFSNLYFYGAIPTR